MALSYEDTSPEGQLEANYRGLVTEGRTTFEQIAAEAGARGHTQFAEWALREAAEKRKTAKPAKPQQRKAPDKDAT